MKPQISCFGLIVICLAALFFPSTVGCGGDNPENFKGDDPEDFEIPDANLRAAIEQELGLPSGALITEEDMRRLTSLDTLSTRGISNLTGLEYATNLKGLYLFDNAIVDISPLTGLTNLEVLELEYNAIVDISPLTGLANLKVLHLFDNAIVDISPLSRLANLEVLHLSGNAIVDISPLTGLTNLKVLHLTNNPLSPTSKNQFIPIIEANGTTVFYN